MKKIIVLFCLISIAGQSQDIVSTANVFLKSLDDTQKTTAQYSLDSEERFNWHFVPRERKGVCFRTFTAVQRTAALEFLKASLSEQGFMKATSIMALDNVLREIEGRPSNDTYRDPLNYYITIFGQPSTKEPWAWRIEGHHVAINFSSVNNEIGSSTPSFFGSNPAIVPSGAEKGKEILKLETDLGFQLINSLSDGQKKKAIISEKALPEIISSNSRKAQPLSPYGIPYTELSEEQKKIMLQLLNVYIKNYQLGFANKLMEKVKKAGIDNLSFAWAGGFSGGTGNYYRIQNSVLLIEYDNTQTNANHVHTTVRDLTNDFAEDILREHYQKEHPKN